MSSSDSTGPKCPRCGGALPADAIVGLCPRCLMVGAMQPTQDGELAESMPPPSPEEIAAHFPQLEVIEFLGRGGMGVVYKARQKALGRLVALKLLAPERVADPKFAERFAHEAKALAALNHPNIVTIHDFGQAGGFFYLLMEFVDGVNLRQAMKAGRFTPEQALAIVPPVCEALQYAHEHGIMHRDIKPENLLLDKEGRVKIADFGIAKMLGSDTDAAVRDDAPQAGTLASVAGTPEYMAPEQKSHRATDHRADIYSLGVVLYELLTGELPADKLQAPSSRLRGMQIDVRLDEIVLRALEKSPELRYQTAGEFRTQVVTLGAGGSRIAARVQRGAAALLEWGGHGLLIAAGSVAFTFGIFFNAIFVFMMVTVPIRFVQVLWRLSRGQLETRLWHRPMAAELRLHRWQLLLACSFWALAIWVLELCIVPVQFSPTTYASIRMVTWTLAAMLVFLEMFPARRVRLSRNVAFLVGGAFMAFQIAMVFWPERSEDAVTLSPPFTGEWAVMQGGPGALTNHHHRMTNQRHALDLVRIVDGSSRDERGAVMAAYASWDSVLFAPADGVVVASVNDLHDNPIGKMDLRNLAGNHLVIEIGADRYVMMAHLREGSVSVAVGDKVRKGQPVAKCGNSGNTTEPHLHLQVQNKASFLDPAICTFPIIFREATVTRAGRPTAFVRRNDKIVASRQLAGASPNLPATSGVKEKATVSPSAAISVGQATGAVGIALNVKDGTFYVGEVLPESPAATNRGIQKNDTILAVAEGDNPAVPVSGKPMAEVVNMLRGRVGTPVRLTLIPVDAKDGRAREAILTRVNLASLLGQGPSN